MKLTTELKSYFEKQGYYNVTEIPGKGICANQKFMFTTGLLYGMTRWAYTGRYCYGTAAQAETALRHWNGEGHAPGMWIKHKGAGIDEPNPLIKA